MAMWTVLCSLFLCFLPTSANGQAYLASWDLHSSERPSGPRCVDIPANLSICHGIEYKQMRLPNLLEHETLNEVIDASHDWKSLLQLSCHPDTKLFLCSLFAPICLPSIDKEILPCRSLCNAVRQGCEKRMQPYGFSWPEMFDCSKYPEDNMCIREVSQQQAGDISCPACSQVPTYENLVDHFCRSSLVLKGKVGKLSGTHLTVRGGRSLKKGDRRRNVPETEIRLSSDVSGCPCGVADGVDKRFLIMASNSPDGHLTANLVLPWKKDKVFKRAIHQFQRLNCKSLGREIRESASRRPHYYAMRKHNTGRFIMF